MVIIAGQEDFKNHNLKFYIFLTKKYYSSIKKNLINIFNCNKFHLIKFLIAWNSVYKFAIFFFLLMIHMVLEKNWEFLNYPIGHVFGIQKSRKIIDIVDFIYL